MAATAYSFVPDLELTSSRTLGGLTIVRFRQRIASYAICGHRISVALDATGNIVGYSGRLIDVPPPQPPLLGLPTGAQRCYWPEGAEVVDLERRGVVETWWSARTGLALHQRQRAKHYNPNLSSETFDVISFRGKLDRNRDTNPQTETVTSPIDLVTDDGLCKWCLDMGSDYEDLHVKVQTTEGAQVSGPTHCVACPTPQAPDILDRTPFSLYFWANDVAGFAHAPTAGYESYAAFSHPENVELVINDEGYLGRAEDHGGFYRILMSRNGNSCAPQEGPLCFTPGECEGDIQTLSHEMGHIIHFYYGWNTSGDRTKSGIDEGFADASHLRYLLYRNERNVGYDELVSGGDYDWGQVLPGNRDYRVERAFLNGEEVPISMVAPVHAISYYQPQRSSTVCGGLLSNGDPESESHQCGSLIPTLFWELARNRIRVGVDGGIAGDQIVQTTSADPRALVQQAFTFAINFIGSDADVADYVGGVMIYYAYQAGVGVISLADKERVRDVARVHCLWDYEQKCASMHRSPGQYLPAAYTNKASFAQGAHLVVDESGLKTAAVLEEVRYWDDFGYLGDAESVLYSSDESRGFGYLDASGEQMVSTFDFPEAGEYVVRVAASSALGGSIKVLGSGSWQPITTELQVPRRLFGEGPRWFEARGFVPGPEKITLSLVHEQGAVAVDVVLVRLVLRGDCTADADGDGVCDFQDRCPGLDDTVFDADRDGICDPEDLCPNLGSLDNSDSDDDGAGDPCDPCRFEAQPSTVVDTDDDGWCDGGDNCTDPTNPAASFNPSQSDVDMDGIGDACERGPEDDLDGDGKNNLDDNCPYVSNNSIGDPQLDSDADGVGDACDCAPYDMYRQYLPQCGVADGLILDRFRNIASYLEDSGWASPWPGRWRDYARCWRTNCDLESGSSAYQDSEEFFGERDVEDPVALIDLIEVVLMSDVLDADARDVGAVLEYRLGFGEEFSLEN